MGTLENRIKTIESRVFVETEKLPEGVFCYVVNGRKDAPPPKPIKGWRYHEHQIMRIENETDEELMARAIAFAKPFLGKDSVPVFHSINEW